MPNFNLQSNFKPTGDQPQAIDKLVRGLNAGKKHQTLLGVTGSGKTFTMANVMAAAQKPTLIISHNKTLAAQLASEFKEFFPENAVHYFVSYYDYYQPEAYIPRSDTYIEKETQINEEIDRLRHASTNSLLTRRDVIIVASVSCIYGLGSPADYQAMHVQLTVGQKIKIDEVLKKLTAIQFTRNDAALGRGTFTVKGDIVEIFPVESADEVVRVEFYGDIIERISRINWLTGKQIAGMQKTKNNSSSNVNRQTVGIFPVKHFVAPATRFKESLKAVKGELAERIAYFKKQGQLLEAQRLEQRTNFDLEMMVATGYCNGIENYSRFLTGRQAGEPPSTLIDYFPKDFLMFVDESHMTLPQIGGMYAGDHSRKQTLIEYGFRLPSAFDNRPLNFKEFNSRINQAVYVSATPAAYEYRLSGIATKKVRVGALAKELVDFNDLTLKINEANSAVSQQVIRPTGLLDPEVEVRKSRGQLDDLIKEIKQTIKQKNRVLVTTMTKRLAEELTDYLQDLKLKVQYLHSEIETLDRLDILRDLRLGKFDVLIGINLLREGLDLPEVSLVVILDADKEGFLRSETSLIQTMGRAARHQDGKVIMYADKITGSMKRAMAEVDRRRVIQAEYNRRHGITPRSIKKDIRDDLRSNMEDKDLKTKRLKDYRQIPQDELSRLIADLENQMQLAAENLAFEEAAGLRDQIKRLKMQNPKIKIKK